MFQEYEFIRESLVAWAANFEPISEQEMGPFLTATSDRGTDNWLPLGIIAKRINREWVKRVQAALDMIEERQSGGLQSAGVQLLSDARDVVSRCSRPEWSSTDLYNSVVFNEETDWSVFNHGRPITKKKFTQMLGEFGVKPTKRSNANVFYVADLEDAFERYLTHTEIYVPHPPHVPSVEGVEGVEGFQIYKSWPLTCLLIFLFCMHY